jgi:mannose-6-phosphate isomerase-like protein (cupin superfamily)
MLPRLLLTLALISALPILAQTASPTIHTAAEFQQLEAKLIDSAKKNPKGVGLAPIDDWGTYNTLLVVRVHTGEAEQHQLWADQMVIQKGTVTLVTGGTILEPNSVPNQPGEVRGTSIQGGKEVVLHPGDIVHIPANLPHWVKLAPGTTATYLVFKEK